VNDLWTQSSRLVRCCQSGFAKVALELLGLSGLIHISYGTHS